MSNHENHEVLLRPVIARLRELQKKCASMGSRNEEFPLMQERLASIIKRLEAGREPSGAPLSYRAIAREIFPVAHLFESVGFLSVGKEIAHIEKTLCDLEPQAADPTGAPPPRKPVKSETSSARISSTSPDPLPEQDPPEDGETHPDSASGLPWPVLIGFVVLLIAVGFSASLIFEIGPFRETPLPPSPLPTEPPAAPTPPPVPTKPPIAESRARPQAVKLAEELSQARLAIARDDLDSAADHLSAAAIIDRDNTTVLEIADQLVYRLVEQADAATEWGGWTEAEQHLERARRIAMRFGIDTNSIDSAAKRHAGMERFSIVGPHDTAAITGAVGQRVVIILANRDRRSGRIEGLDGAVLLLAVDSDVEGGVVRYTDEISLDAIASIRIYED